MTPASPPASRLPPHGFWAGLAATAPVVPGAVAFGLVYGVLARQAGLSLWATTAMSVLVFAGAAQFTAVSIALAISRYLRGEGSREFLLGANLGLYGGWTLSTLVGGVLGGLVVDPGRWGIALVFPLTFLGLLVPLLGRPVTVVVAGASGIVAVATAAWLPGKGNLVLAILVGGAIGAVLEAWWTPTA